MLPKVRRRPGVFAAKSFKSTAAGRWKAAAPLADAGMLTAETAIVLPVLVLVLAGALWVLLVVAGQLQCIDAARAGVRLAARGEAGATAVDAARRAAPDGARVRVRRGAGTVAVTVTAVVRPFGGWAGRLAPARVSSTAEALDETALPEPALRDALLPEPAP